MCLTKIEKKLNYFCKRALKRLKDRNWENFEIVRVIIPADDITKMLLLKKGHVYKNICFDIFVGPKEIVGDDYGFVTFKYKNNTPNIVYGTLIPGISYGVTNPKKVNIDVGEN